MNYRMTDELIMPEDMPSVESKTGLELDYSDQGIGTDAIGAVSYNNHCNEKKEGKTMANIVKKSDLKFEDGYLSTKRDGAIIAPGFVQSYIALEDFLQRAAFDNANKPVDARFVRESNIADRMIEVPAPKTPTLDADAKHADEVARDEKAIRAYEEAIKVLDEFNSVVEFVSSKTVVLYDDDYKAVVIDTPVLGDPLKLTKDRLLTLVCEAVEYNVD